MPWQPAAPAERPRSRRFGPGPGAVPRGEQPHAWGPTPLLPTPLFRDASPESPVFARRGPRSGPARLRGGVCRPRRGAGPAFTSAPVRRLRVGAQAACPAVGNFKNNCGFFPVGGSKIKRPGCARRAESPLQAAGKQELA